MTRTVDDFHSMDYIEDASDNVDGNLKDKVTASELDASLDDQVITYRISDSSGNTVTAELKVILVDPVIATPEPTAPVAPSGTGAQQDDSSQNAEPAATSAPIQSGSRAGETKYYWFTDGYDIDSAYNA